MSDSWLQFIPADPAWSPTVEAAKRAEALLAAWTPEADSVEHQFKTAMEFFAPGENWSGVACPACAADLEAWWNEAMNAAFARDFSDLTVTTPCCGEVRSLNDLHYVWPAGFGRFVLEAMNPNIADLGLEREAALAEAVGGPLRKVWVRI